MIVSISDTHGLHRKVTLPDGDVLVHAGDFSAGSGSVRGLMDFNAWLGEIKSRFSKIIVVAGNHDMMLEEFPSTARHLFTNCIYLENEEIVIDGVKFYGSPVTPWFHSWAFNVDRGDLISKVWARIPDDTGVLITHGPPHGIMDVTPYGNIHVGCEDLYDRIYLLPQLKLHIFGHIHDGHGTMMDGDVMFVNASICDEKYRATNQPIVVEI